MKVSELPELIPILEGLRNGQTLQIASFPIGAPSRGWRNAMPGESIALDCSPDYYRLKPEPKLRAWTQAEALPLIGKAVFRFKRAEGNCQIGHVGLLVGACPDWLYFATGKEPQRYDFSAKHLEHSLDGGRPGSWLPCGVMEEAQ